jgi:hypothetical protein
MGILERHGTPAAFDAHVAGGEDDIGGAHSAP